MGLLSPLFYFAGVALLLAFLSLPLFKAADVPPTAVRNRVGSLDGLRGFAALSVAFHHAAIYHRYLTDGRWVAPPSYFFNDLGRASVGMFFIITAYLFWAKVMAARGALDFPALLLGRVFRIGPVYLLAIAIFVIANLYLDGFSLRMPLADFAWETLQNLELGFVSLGAANGHSSVILAGVTWTLPHEWQFYLSLPLLGIAARWPRFVLPPLVAGCAVLALVAWGTNAIDPTLMLLFGGGMLWATIADQYRLPKVPRVALSSLALLQLALIAIASQEALRGGWPAILLTGAFACIMLGGDLFGLFRLRAARRLGDISYPLYLMHGPVLAATFAIPPIRDAALSGPLAYWGICILAIATALIVALLVHVTIEVPGIELGRRLARRMRAVSFPISEATAPPTAEKGDLTPEKLPAT
jgi:peptidoglycan/LPS O-acetylase OafA/YrhL